MTTNLKVVLLTGWLLAGFCLSSCDRQGFTLTIHVNGWEDGDGPLQAVPRVADQLGQSITVDAQTPDFSIHFDKDQPNFVIVDGLIAKSSGCRYALGSVSVDLRGRVEVKSSSAQLNLTHLDNDACVHPQCNSKAMQWCQQNPVTGRSLQAVWADKDHAWAVGDDGIILRWIPPTITSAERWQYETSPTVSTLNAIWGRGPSDVWAVGFAGTVIRFKENKWSNVPSSDIGSATLYAVGGNQTDLWVGGDKFFKYQDSSSSWLNIPVDITFIHSIWGMNDGTTWIAGEDQKIFLRPSDSRNTVSWGNENFHFRGIWGSSINSTGTFWAVGSNGAVCSGSNPSWMCNRQVDMRITLTAVSGNQTQLWAVGTEGTIVGKASTALWSSALSPSRQNLNSVYAVDNGGPVWAVGNNGTILRYN